MSDNLASFLKDLLIFLTLALTVYSQFRTKAAVVQTKETAEETKKAVEKTEVKIDQLEKNTNNKFDKLLDAKDQLSDMRSKSARAEGNLEGRAEEKELQRDSKSDGPSLGHLEISELVVPEQTITVEPPKKNQEKS